MTELIKIAIRNIFRNKRRSLFCIAAIFVAVSFIVFIKGMTEGMYGNFETIIKNFEVGDIAIYHKDFEKKKVLLPLQYPIEFENKNLTDIIEDIKKIDGVSDVFPRILTHSSVTNNFVKHIIIWGIDFENETKNKNFNLKTKSNGLIEGNIPDSNKNECLIGVRLAKKMNLKIGDKIISKIISSQFSDKFFELKITGIFDFDCGHIDSNYIIMPFSRLQKIGVLLNKTQTLYIFTKNPKNSYKIKEIVQKLINNPNIIVRNWEESPEYLANVKTNRILMQIIYIVFIVIASLLIINTVLMAIYERIREIGIIGSLGMTSKEIVFLFFFEGLVLSLIGGFLGMLIGGISTFVLSFFPVDLEKMIGGVSFASNTIFVKFSPIDILYSGFYSILISTLCIILPSLKVAFINPINCLRK